MSTQPHSREGTRAQGKTDGKSPSCPITKGNAVLKRNPD